MNDKHIDTAINIVDDPSFAALLNVGRVGKCAEIIAAALAEAEREGMRRAAEIALRVGNFGDYRREELTRDYGQPRFDMMADIIDAILSVTREG